MRAGPPTTPLIRTSMCCRAGAQRRLSRQIRAGGRSRIGPGRHVRHPGQQRRTASDARGGSRRPCARQPSGPRATADRPHRRQHRLQPGARGSRLAGLACHRPPRGLAHQCRIGPGTLLLSMLLPAWTGWRFAPAACMLGLVLAYPLWSWRRLSAAAQFLRAEIEHLQREGMLVLKTPRQAPVIFWSGASTRSRAPRASCATCTSL